MRTLNAMTLNPSAMRWLTSKLPAISRMVLFNSRLRTTEFDDLRELMDMVKNSGFSDEVRLLVKRNAIL